MQSDNLCNWKKDLQGLVGEREDEKIDKLCKKVKRLKRENYQVSIISISSSFMILVMVVLYLWLFTELGNEARADIANGTVAIFVASWSLCKPKPKTLSQKDVTKILGKAVESQIFEKINQDASDTHTNTDKTVELTAAIALFCIIFFKYFT